MWSQREGQYWATELNWRIILPLSFYFTLLMLSPHWHTKIFLLGYYFISFYLCRQFEFFFLSLVFQRICNHTTLSYNIKLFCSVFLVWRERNQKLQLLLTLSTIQVQCLLSMFSSVFFHTLPPHSVLLSRTSLLLLLCPNLSQFLGQEDPLCPLPLPWMVFFSQPSLTES